jgi:3-methyladenine DNA glycosylase/8-oxoguanine DNA glycosylase
MGDAMPEPPGAIARLMEELGKLPGIGPKSAERITHFLLSAGSKEVLPLADALRDIAQKVHPFAAILPSFASSSKRVTWPLWNARAPIAASITCCKAASPHWTGWAPRS